MFAPRNLRTIRDSDCIHKVTRYFFLSNNKLIRRNQHSRNILIASAIQILRSVNMEKVDIYLLYHNREKAVGKTVNPFMRARFSLFKAVNHFLISPSHLSIHRLHSNIVLCSHCKYFLVVYENRFSEA